MAANDYHHHQNIPAPSYDHYVTPGQTDRLPTAPGYGYASPNMYNQNDPSAPYHHRQSQQSFQSDNGAYPAAAGRVTDGDQYAENIPLKAQTQFGNNPDWTHQQTQYPPPSPGGLEDRRQMDNRKKRGFFRKKPAWMTWLLTTIQVIVFIVELVKSGKYRTVFGEATTLEQMN